MATPVRHTRFLGASVSSFSINVGWNEDVGSLTVTLVEDPNAEITKYDYATHADGVVPETYEATAINEPDSFQQLKTGSPVHFRFEDFVFNGILQSWIYKQGFNGWYYEVIIQSPNIILQNVELIINGYNGSVSGISNLINIYGYYENIAYGSAQVNEGGMPWPVLKTGLQLLANSINLYSGGIYFKGVNYLINLDQVPIAPTYYRINGNTVNALSVISQLYQDSSCDYITDLRYESGVGIINFRTVSRRNQPALTLLRDFIAARTDASQKDRGIELRNEVSSAFVIGGPVQDLYTQTLAIETAESATIWPYWGLNTDGNAIIGQGFNDDHTFDLDSRAVECPGVGATYQCTVGEIRAAMAGMDAWKSYIALSDTLKASQLNIQGTFYVDGDMNAVFTSGKGNAISNTNTRPDAAAFLSDETRQQALSNLFSFVQNVANEYYGYKFMVRVPNVVAKREPDTAIVITSDEPSDGGYLSFIDWSLGNSPLNLPAAYKDIFTLEDGRYVAFVKFENASSYDLKDLSPDTAVVEDDNLYIKCTIEPYFVYLNAETFDSPRVVLTLPSQINTKIDDPRLFGPASLVVKAVMKADGNSPLTEEPTEAQIENAYNIVKKNGDNFAGQFPADFGPFANLPHYACVPLKSNIQTYGPWFSIGPQGRVRVEQDPELVPWNFNGYTYLDNAGRSKVIDVAAAQEAGETGTVELVGAPTIQIGDALVVGGPNVTGIDVSVSVGGVTTSYRMRTYTPTFGAFAKYNADKFQRLSRVARDNERKALANNRGPGSWSPAYFKARERFFFTKQGTKGNKQGTPHPVIGASYFEHPSIDGASGVSTAVMSLEEGMKCLTNDKYNTHALMSLDGLFRPYSVYPTGSLNHFENPAWTGFLDVRQHNPFNYEIDGDEGIGDVEVATYGSGYPENGLQSFLNPFETNVRLVGLKGPLVLTGWGYDLYGKPVPNVSGDKPLPQTNTNEFAANFRQKGTEWKTGPVNLRWNSITKMWESPSKFVVGKWHGNSGGVNNGFELYCMHGSGYTGGDAAASGTKIRMPIAHFFNTSSTLSGTKMACVFVDNHLVPIATDC